MNFSELTSNSALRARIRSTIQLLYNSIGHIRDAPAGNARADKAACEILLLLWGLKCTGFSDTEVETAVQNLLIVTEQRLRAPSIIQGLLWKPARVSMLCMGTALLNALGRHNDKFDGIALSAWRKLFLDSSERSPFQLLEVQWSANLIGLNNPLVDAMPSCLLHRKTCPLFMSVEDGYAFTHSVFYITNFGHSHLSPKINMNDVWEAIESGILWSLLRFDFDLLGEFLLSALYCQLPFTPTLYVGLCALFLTWDENGFVPDRELNLTSSSKDAIFYGIYHANLVAALLSSELMARNVDYKKGSLPLFISPSSCQALLEKLTLKLQASCVDQCVDYRNNSIATRSLLENILGRVVTENLISVLGDAYLSSVHPDLLLSYGIIYQDIEAILTGAQKSLSSGKITPTMGYTAEWLIMVMEIYGSENNYELPEIIEIRKLLQSLRTSLTKHSSGFR